MTDDLSVAEEAADLLERLSRERGTVPEGWVLVPKEPTDEMYVAALRVTRDPENGHVADHVGGAVYRAMIYAAPPPPSVSSEIERLRAELEQAREAIDLSQEAIAASLEIAVRRGITADWLPFQALLLKAHERNALVRSASPVPLEAPG